MSLVSSELVVKPVVSSRERTQFLNLPWTIYQGNDFWIPPLQANQKELTTLAPHPFYKNNAGQPFLALRNGVPVGRILAIHNEDHNRLYKEQRGFWGFFECEDNVETAQALFAAAKKWLKERGLTTLRGPTNPSMNYESGLLVEGFDSSPYFMMTYNLPYYEALVQACGQTCSQNMYAFWGHVDMLKGLDSKLEFVVNECKRRFNVKMRRLNRWKLSQEVRMFLDIYNQSMVGMWGFVPMSNAEADHMAGSLKMLLVPEVTTIAEVDGKPVGAVFGLLDYNSRIKAINGKLFPFGWLRLLWNKKAIKRMRLISTNVIPEYQRWGLGVLLLSRLVPDALEWGMQEAEFSWVLESNALSYKSLKRGGAQITKTYRLYDGEL